MTEPLVDVTGARQRRQRARMRRRMIVAGIVAGVLAVIGVAVWVVWASPWFSVTKVEVRGTQFVSAEQVQQVAEVPLGTSLAALDTQPIAHRITENIPPVATATVAKAWPDTVTIDVTERTAVMVVPRDGHYAWVAPDGVVFHATPDVPAGLMTAQGNIHDEAVLAALGKVAGALPPEVREKAASIDAQTPDSVVINLRDKRRVIWGSADESELKAKVLLPLLGVRATEYDVTAPSHPTTR